MSTKIYSLSGTEAASTSTITYQSIPNLKNWGCTEWILYHKALAAQVGKTKAAEIWTTYFKRLSVWSSVYNWCKYNNEFSSYLKAQGIDVGNIFSDIHNAASSAAKTTLSLLNIGIKILPWAAGAYGIWWLSKNTAAGKSATTYAKSKLTTKKATTTKRKRK